MAEKSSVFARDALSEVQLFHRCYSQITGLRAKPGHPQLAQVIIGSRSAADACLDVMAKANLVSSGANEGLTVGEVTPADSSDLPDARGVLNSFQNFHKAFFRTGPLHTAAGLEESQAQDDIWSPFEAASHVTRLLFTPSEEYRNLIRGVRSVRDLRTSTATTNRFGLCRDDANNVVDCFATAQGTFFRHNYRRNPDGSMPDGFIADVMTWTPPLFQIGTLRGLKLLSSAEMDEEIRLSYNARSSDGELFENSNWRDNVKEKYRKPFGAGAIGTQSYLQLNSDLGTRAQGYPRTDGGARVWRRLSQSVLRDFMCRDLPVLNVSDAVPYVRPAGTLPWQANSTCMGCHSTIDGMAGVSRNIGMTTITAHSAPPASFPNRIELNALISHPTTYANSGDQSIRLRTTKRNGGPATYATDNPLGLFGITSDNTWFKQAPKGAFLIRDMNGNLIQRDIYGLDAMPSESSLPGLSDVVTDTDDYYVCAAKRYFKYFTDYDASLMDVPNSSPREVQARDFVVSEGRALKQHQNLQYLIRQIISSSFYKEGI